MLNKVIMMIAALAICASSITLTGCEDPEAKAKAELKAKTLQQVHEAGELGRNKEKLHNLMGDLAPKPKDSDTAEEK